MSAERSKVAQISVSADTRASQERDEGIQAFMALALANIYMSRRLLLAQLRTQGQRPCRGLQNRKIVTEFALINGELRSASHGLRKSVPKSA